MAPGEALDVALVQAPRIQYVKRPERAADAASYGGLLRIRIVRAGVYRIALDSGAWLDVVSGDHSLESVFHGHGPSCSGIHKMVDFRLEPGDYWLQIEGNIAPTVRAMIVVAPQG